MTLSPIIACTLTGEDLSKQSRRWQQLRTRAEIERVEVEDGLRVRFRCLEGVEQELRALVAVEIGCCAWARWEVVREADSFVMAVSSIGEGVAALHSMFDESAAGAKCACHDC